MDKAKQNARPSFFFRAFIGAKILLCHKLFYSIVFNFTRQRHSADMTMAAVSVRKYRGPFLFPLGLKLEERFSFFFWIEITVLLYILAIQVLFDCKPELEFGVCGSSANVKNLLSG